MPSCNRLATRDKTEISVLQVNPYFMAGWVGLLVTALNMMPVSQLDGGHITYCMFGRGPTGSPAASWCWRSPTWCTRARIG